MVREPDPTSFDYVPYPDPVLCPNCLAGGLDWLGLTVQDGETVDLLYCLFCGWTFEHRSGDTNDQTGG